MAKSPENEEKRGTGTPPNEPQAQPAEGAQAQQRAQAQRRQIKLDDSKIVTAYANFCRVTGTAEELVLDFGLNTSSPFGPPPESIPVTQRIIINYYTAKRMLQVLHQTIQQHENTFGVLEVDIQKRLTPGMREQLARAQQQRQQQSGG